MIYYSEFVEKVWVKAFQVALQHMITVRYTQIHKDTLVHQRQLNFPSDFEHETFSAHTYPIYDSKGYNKCHFDINAMV